MTEVMALRQATNQLLKFYKIYYFSYFFYDSADFT